MGKRPPEVSKRVTFYNLFHIDDSLKHAEWTVSGS